MWLRLDTSTAEKIHLLRNNKQHLVFQEKNLGGGFVIGVESGFKKMRVYAVARRAHKL